MPSVAELQNRICQEIDNRRADFIDLAEIVLKNPETGFREVKTAALVSRQFTGLGIPHRTGIALTGIKGLVNGGTPGPTVCVFGELDSLIAPEHPFADKLTGAAHVCGHNVQIAILCACAAAITKSGILPHLAGRVVFIAVPAEEGIEIDFRNSLRRKGKISYLCGKQEFIKLGELDDIDIAMMTHTSPEPEVKKLAQASSWNGNIRKIVRFTGRAAHAGSAPHAGINALNAAMLALSAIHAQRETFRDDDAVRIHPIITRGGDVVNAVPADVRLESYIRARFTPAMLDANLKFDRSLRAGAMAVGARVSITTIPGGMPLAPHPFLWEILETNAARLIEKEDIARIGHRGSSSDFGDVSQIIPAVHPFSGGATGTPHGADYLINDYETALIIPAKVLAMTVIDLLAEGAARAKKVIDLERPPMTKEQYIKAMDNLFNEEDYQG